MLSCVGWKCIAPGVGDSGATGPGEDFAGGYPVEAGSRGVIGLHREGGLGRYRRSSSIVC